MAIANAERTDQRPSRASLVGRRVGGLRWILLAATVLLLIATVAGAMSPLAAILVFAGLLVAAAVVPVAAGPAAGTPLRAEPVAPPSPDAGLTRLAEALPDPCFILDRRGLVRHANALALAAFPIRVGDSLTARLRVPDLLAAFERVAAGGPPERVEFAERVPTERWFAAWLAPLKTATPAIALILDDLSERRRTEKIRVDFVANASHELRTPLASLVGFIETLQGPARDDPAARERFLKIMHEQGTRMSRLVDDLLSLSRVEMKAHLRPSGQVDLVAVIRQLADAMEPLARDLGVAIEAGLPAAPAIVTGDRDELTQVFANLIENACKYGQAGGRVVVSVRPEGQGEGATVTVRDFGQGIAPEHLPRLTERFYRIDVDASRRHRGTGLGLAIAKHILARHQARLAIDSRLGEGSTFTVIFPQASLLQSSSVPEDSSFK
ncbi:MAG: two-component sensor histidine kinase [Rhizobiales bacterium]|nr:two-component sensor histidine kinase [Hyphomicrobiales bacterium]